MSHPVWPACDGDTAALIRTRDWSATPLGPLDQWEPVLRMHVEVVLRSPFGMALVWGPERILIYNDAYAVIAGAKHPQMFGATVRDAWPEAWDFNRAVFDAGFAGETREFRDAHFVLKRPGLPDVAWFDLSYWPAVDARQRIRGVMCSVIETTDRMLAQQERDLQEQRLQQANTDLEALRVGLERANSKLAGDMDFLNTLFRQAPSFMAVLTGPDHVFELANDAYLRLVQQRQVIGKPVRDALPEVVGQGFLALLDQVYREGQPFHGRAVDVELVSQDGRAMERRILDFVYQPLKDARGATYGIFVEGIDITDHALTEERLRVAQEAGEIGTFEWYPSTGMMVVSDAYRRLWGFAPETVITADLLVSHVVEEYRHLSGPAKLAHSDNPLGYVEYLIRRADTGEQRWIARRGQAVASTIAGERRYLGVAFDITERKHIEHSLREAQDQLRELNEALERKVVSEEHERFKAEEALRQAQKMEAVGQLASGVAHDFNNVLQIISSNLQLMELDGIPPALAARLANAVAAVERGSKLSSQLLAFARRQPLSPKSTHLGRLVAEMESLLQRAMGDRIEIDLRSTPDLWNVEVDRNQIENAILNMAINARDAMAGAGRLTIALNNVTGEDGDQVCLAITDTGCGMPPEVLAKIFDPFYTTKAPGKGTGLGMSMVYGFVKQSGGEVKIDSSPGRGTTIRICLPRAHAAAVPDEALDHDSEAGYGETILVVDDDPAVVASTIEILSSLGYAALSAADGQAAVDILKSGVRVDLLFTDLSMPGAVDCAALVAHCRALAPDAAILVTSGHRPDGALAGGIDLLPKPYSRAQLARAVRQQLGSPAEGAHPAASVAGAPAVADNAEDACNILVVEDDPDTRELACELLAALGHKACGSGSAEQALAQLKDHEVDILFTDLNLPGLSGVDLAGRAVAACPGLKVILTSGEGKHIPLPAGSPITLLPKPYDLVQLQLSIAQAARTAMQHSSDLHA